jgi:hypothetical protein
MNRSEAKMDRPSTKPKAVKATIALKNAESALVETRARILGQLASVNTYRHLSGSDAQRHGLLCLLITLDCALDRGALRDRVFQFSNALYRGKRSLELRRARARANRLADRAAA